LGGRGRDLKRGEKAVVYRLTLNIISKNKLGGRTHEKERLGEEPCSGYKFLFLSYDITRQGNEKRKRYCFNPLPFKDLLMSFPAREEKESDR